MDEPLTDKMVEVLAEKVPELANATTDQEVETIINRVRPEAEKRVPAFVDDRQIYRYTVWILGIVVIGALAAQAVLAYPSSAKEIPQGIVALGSAAIGALAGLLAPTAK